MQSSSHSPRPPVQLSRWFIKWANKRRTKIMVEGLRAIVGADGKQLKQRWHSSVLVKRVGQKVMATSSGSLYELLGEYNKSSQDCDAIPPTVAEFFKSGFPPNWEGILKIESHLSKAHSGKATLRRSNEGNEKENRPSNKMQRDSPQKSQKDMALSCTKDEQPLLPGNESINAVNSTNKFLAKQENKRPSDEKLVKRPILVRKCKTEKLGALEDCEVEDQADRLLDDLDLGPAHVNLKAGRTGEQWSADELRRLRRAHATCTSRADHFWDAIARKVSTRTAQECYNQWCRVFVPRETHINKRRAEEKKKCEGPSKYTGKLGGRGTAKYRKQVRQAFEAMEEGCTDDIFESTPFKTRPSEKTLEYGTKFGFDTGVPTPLVPAASCKRRQAQASVSSEQSSECDSESDLDGRVDRDKVDYYIAGLTKRRKGKEHGGVVSNSEKVQLIPTTSWKQRNHSKASVRDHGAKGEFTPGGSVRLDFDLDKFRYEFSDEGESNEDEDFIDDATKDRETVSGKCVFI